MPTYDYVCEGCGHRFEHFQSMNSRRLRKCPECGERKLERLVGAGAGLIFKGSGFYETDYKRAGPGSKRSSAGADGETKKEGGKGEGKAPGTDAGGGGDE